MRHLSLLYCFLLCTLTTVAQTAVGTWRSHLAYHNATQCAVVGDKVYVVSDGSLYSYTPSDEYVESYDKSNLLSDQSIRHIAVDEQTNILVVVYNNANIDLVYPDGSVTNITDFANATTLDPTINSLCIVKGKAYIATNFGATVLDVAREEFADTYILNKVTHSCIEFNNALYAATEEGLYRGELDHNLLDMANWTKVSDEVYAQLAIFDKSLMALKAKEAVYKINATDHTAKLFRGGPMYFMHNAAGKLIVGNPDRVYVYTTSTQYVRLNLDGAVTWLTASGDTYWSCNGASGLNAYRYNKETQEAELLVSHIQPNSPIRNHCQYLSFVGDRLLVAGGCINYFGSSFYDGTLMMYEEGSWHAFEEKGINKRTAGPYKNMTSIVQDPKDPRRHYASSFGQGIYEFYDMQFVRQYTHKAKSGYDDVVAWPLESVIPSSYEYTRISRLQYDAQGNLWISNADGEAKIGDKHNNVDAPLKVLKPDGTLHSLYYKELENQATVTELLFDHNGWLWGVSMQGPPALFCIDLNGTLENTADDRIKVFGEKFVDQDGGSVEVYYINDIAEDLEGDIWVMTDKGPYVLYNTEKAFTTSYHFTKIKVPRNDGTNYADYLLDGAYTTCIEVDAANRKWIGTLSNGLYLVGPEGLETVHHFTKDNTPLPSNTIESLALHHPTGELFIGTDKGLIAYTTDATRGEESYREERVYAYPNPVTPDYDGPITIIGLKSNTAVKVINAAGRLVAEGTSLGGSFTWNARTPQGQRVATGIYYVLGCDDEGREGIVTKVLFVR